MINDINYKNLYNEILIENNKLKQELNLLKNKLKVKNFFTYNNLSISRNFFNIYSNKIKNYLEDDEIQNINQMINSDLINNLFDSNISKNNNSIDKKNFDINNINTQINYEYNNHDNIKNNINLNNIKINYDSKFKEEVYSSKIPNQICFFKSINNENLLVFSKYKKYRLNKKFSSLVCYDIKSNNIVKFIQKNNLFKITCIRHFLINNKDIIITSSEDNLILIYNVSNNWNIMSKIENVGDNKKEFDIYSINFVYLNNKNNNYIVTSCYNDNNLKLYNFNGNFLKSFCNCLKVKYIEHFYDSKKKQNFIILSNFEGISSYFFDNGNLYHNYYKNQSEQNSFIIKEMNNKIFLYFSNKIAIYIFDFHSGQLIKQINVKDIISMLLWNDNYLILGGKKLYLLELNNLNEIKCINEQKITNSYNLIKVKNDNQEYIYQLMEYKYGINIWKVSY